jgi:hypothetical protein
VIAGLGQDVVAAAVAAGGLCCRLPVSPKLATITGYSGASCGFVTRRRHCNSRKQAQKQFSCVVDVRKFVNVKNRLSDSLVYAAPSDIKRCK